MSFGRDPAENPGRANRWELGGVTAIVDYAHNPHGMAALAQVVLSIAARRRGLVIGQAGDRGDAAIRDFVRAAWAMQPAQVFIKEMVAFLRGREPGAVPAVIASELGRLGLPAAASSRHADELGAVRAALEWSRPGDVLVLTAHAERDAVTALLRELVASGWRPTDALPHRAGH
jgi:UDP-N-acetylmuramyl tripeptide synthase